MESQQILHAAALHPWFGAACMLANLWGRSGTASAQQPDHLADPPVVSPGIVRFHLAAFFALSWLTFAGAVLAAGQAAQLPERPGEHRHSMDMNLPSGVTNKCEPAYTYDEGPRGPSHWDGVCNVGHMQTPIDISNPEKVSLQLLPQLLFYYQPVELDIVNDCNNYQASLPSKPVAQSRQEAVSTERSPFSRAG